MNVLILYYSKGGNTRKLADAIAEGAALRSMESKPFCATPGMSPGTTSSPPVGSS